MPNTPDSVHCEPITIDNVVYRYDSPLPRGVNEPKLFVSASDAQKKVVVKHFGTAALSRVAMAAHATWQGARDVLVPAGFPKIIDINPTRQINEYLPGISFGDIPDQTITTTIDMLRIFLASVTHHLDLLADNGLQHGDVKIDNMVALRNPIASHPACSMLIDFDYLHPIGVCTPDHLGTVMHAPPEVLQKQMSHRTRDIYSLGFSAIHTLMGEADRFQFDQHRWAYGYFYGDFEGIKQYRTQRGIPMRIIEQAEQHMRDTLLPFAAERETELDQILSFISTSIQNDIDRRPQSGREIRQMLGM